MWTSVDTHAENNHVRFINMTYLEAKPYKAIYIYI